MSKHFTDAASEGLVRAREAALHRGSAELRPVDLAVGMLAATSGVAARAMAQLSVSHESARAALEEITQAEVLDHATKPTLSPWCKQTLVFAMHEQAASDADAVGTGHVLLGATAVPDWLLDKLLERLGVDRDAIRAAVFTVLSSDRNAVEREGLSLPLAGRPFASGCSGISAVFSASTWRIRASVAPSI